MREDASTVLSGGAAGRWYFDWFRDRGPKGATRHIGIELEPSGEDLPPGVELHRGNLARLEPAADGSIDLVFAGQVTEHLWPAELAGFLESCHRVLRENGTLVVDSPNRLVSRRLGWTQPQHTFEVSPAEFGHLLDLAGFELDGMRGVWLCADPESGRLFPLFPDPEDPVWSLDRRAERAGDAPDLSFIWWATATRSGRSPDTGGLHRQTRRLYGTIRTGYFETPMLRVPEGEGVSLGSEAPAITRSSGNPGVIVFGPYIAFPPGRTRMLFSFKGTAPSPELAPHTVVGRIEAISEAGRITLARRDIRLLDLPRRIGSKRSLQLSVHLDQTVHNVELRVFGNGLATISLMPRVAVADGQGASWSIADRIRRLTSRASVFFAARRRRGR